MSKAVVSEFHDHPFPARIIFVASAKGWRKFLKSIGNQPEPCPESDASVEVFAPPGSQEIFLIRISKRAREYSADEVMALLVHELVHVKQGVERRMYGQNIGSGMFSNRMDTETEAYFIQKMLLWISHAYSEMGHGFRAD